ncbi:MAG TPA: type II toxin-antitoxin system PemK/MazF family toxin [Thermoanaerobaculia bacterium]
MVVSRFEVWLISLDPARGAEIQKTRPCVVVSPDEMNHNISTVIVAPMTTKTRGYPTRVPVTFHRKRGEIVLDQLRTIDKGRLIRKLGKIDENTAHAALAVLCEMFGE